MGKNTNRYTIPARTVPGIDLTILCKDFRNITFSLSSIVGSDQVIKFCASVQEDKPDFTAAQSPTNEYDFISVYDLQNASLINGDTGVTFTGADTRKFQINSDAINWVGFIVTVGTGGSLSGNVLLADNN